MILVFFWLGSQLPREWVASCLGQMTDGNREEAQAELRQVISDAYSSKTLWTTDWAGVQLKSLLPKPMPIMSNHSFKRKLDSPTGQSKKAKKHQANKYAAALALDVGDRAALNRRAERFRREHELEKQKQNGGGGQASSLRTHQRSAHPFVNLSRSATPFANADDPEANPNVPNWDQHTIVGTSQEIFKDYLRLTSVRIACHSSGLSEVFRWILGPKTRSNTSVPCSPTNANRTQETMAREGSL
jgi:hypothetical protein